MQVYRIISEEQYQNLKINNLLEETRPTEKPKIESELNPRITTSQHLQEKLPIVTQLTPPFYLKDQNWTEFQSRFKWKPPTLKTKLKQSI